MYSRIIEARQGGPVEIDLKGHNCNVDVTVDPNCANARVELYTDATTGPTPELIDKLRLDESRGTVRLHLPEEAGGGSVQINSFGRGYSSVMVNSGGGIFVGGDAHGVIMTGGGNADMTVNGQRIQVRGGKTYINGILADGAGNGAPAGDPPSVIHIRVTVPAGSTARVETYNGHVRSVGASAVWIKTYNGNVRATGLTTDSRIKSYNGNLAVGAGDGARPAVVAETYNGNIQALDDDVRLRPKTYNGDVPYPR
jgi:hypothetical protein